MKNRKRIIALLLVVVLMIPMVPVAAFTAHAADEDYEEMYGITYEQLFTLYPGYLTPDSESYITRVLTEQYVDALDSHAGESTYLQSFLDVIADKGAMEIVIDTILEGLNLAKNKEEELLRETIYLLMNNIYIDKNTASTVLSMIDEDLKCFEQDFDVFDKVGKEVLIAFLVEHTDTLPDSDIVSIVNEMVEDAESIKDAIGAGVEFGHAIQAVVLLNEVQRTNLLLVQDSVPKGGTIYRAIDVLLDDMDQDIASYVAEHYLVESVLKKIGEITKLEDIVNGNAVVKATDAILVIFRVVSDRILVKLLNYATATEMNHTVILSGYVQGLHTAVLDRRSKFILAYYNKEPMGRDELEDYEFIYAAYVAAIKTTLEAACKIAKTDSERGYIKKAIELCDKLTFDKYLQLCLVALKNDIDSGVIAAPSTDIGFPEWCIESIHPTSGTLVVTKDNANIMDRPCSVNTDMNARRIEQGELNAQYTVTAICTNIATNIWYQIITKSGETGYIYSGNCYYTPGTDVTLTGVSMPTTIAVGSRHYIKGTISTQYSTLLSVSCNVYDMNGNWKTGGTVDVNAKSYVLDYSAIDAATEFNILGVGTYRCEISAIASSGSNSENVVLYAANLTVYDPSAGTTTPNAESAEFVTRNDGVWLWPLSREAYNKFTDWAGCNGDWSCPFPGHSGNNHGGCLAPHETADGLGHNGIDIGAVETVYAMAAGTAYTREDGVRGKYIVIEHPIGIGTDGERWSYYTYYQHLSSFAVGNGAAVDAGTPIGVSGNTGLSTAAHLHVGMVLGHCDSYDAIGYLESKGWVLSPGFQEGRIVNNPARNSPAGYPTGYYVDNLYLHAGSVMFTFDKADIVIGEGNPKECSHSYVGVETAPTCDSAGYITYTCSICGDSYIENPYEAWSEWTTSYPVGISAKLIRTRTEYRHQDKEFTTSTSDTLPGWTLEGPTTIYGEYGEWSDWSDAPATESDIVKVETRTVWPYYYFLCSNCGAHMHGYGTCWTWAGGCGAPTYDWGWREVWSTTSWDSANLRDWLGTGKYYTYINGELVFKLGEAAPKTQYRYCTREAIDGYSFYRWGEWSDWSAAPCTSSDTRNAETRTAYSYYTGPLAEHNWGDGVVTVEPTEETEGLATYTCLQCTLSRTEPIPKLEHEHRYDAVVTAPTCTVRGYTTHTCRCGDSYVSDYTDALGHDMGEWTVDVEATCTESGKEIRRCSRCNHSESRTIEARGHEWNDGVVTLEPTEETEGEMTYTCERCGKTRTESIPRLDHEHHYDAIVTAPTCNEKGYTTHTCRCGDSYIDSYTNALGHCFRNYISDDNATCTQDGTKTAVCDRCDATDTMTDAGSAHGHNFSEWAVTKAPTQTTEGEEYRYCYRCGLEETRMIARLENPFTDVPEGSFYYEPVLWAVAKGITNGTSATTFSPDNQCMRAHVVTFLWRAAGSPEPKSDNNPFVDVKEPDFYYKAVLWAVEKGITNGLDATHFGPTTNCNRAQVVTFLYRAMGSPSVTSAENPFTDVPEGQWFTAPVLWAVKNGITNGISATSFGPNSICNRAQIVTFLYRAYN